MGAAGNDRRIVALKLAIGRRERLDGQLQAALAAKRDDHLRARRQHDEQLARVAGEQALLRDYHERIAGMMSSANAVPLAQINAAMRYAEIVADRVRQTEKDLASLQAALAARADELAAAARALANNRGRLDLCSGRVSDLRNLQERQADDSADEEAEENALARLRASAQPASSH